MRKFCYLMLFVCLFMCSSTYGQEEYEAFSYSSESAVPKQINLPIIRNIYGGTKIIPIYEGNWTNEMKGAFEYACKIWEEVMPTTFPIRIKAILDEKTSSYQNKPILSKINCNIIKHTEDQNLNYPPYSSASTWTQIKGNEFFNLIGKYQEHTYKYIIKPDMFKEPDITIRYYNYNERLTKSCSFSLDGISDSQYYDFVTLVLRDIAKSFGFIWNNKIIRKPEQLTINKDNAIPFEKDIISKIGEDPHQAYLNATKGELSYCGMKLYAPKEWDTERSLNYFIPNETKKLTELLSYNFGKGTVVRDISDKNINTMFEKILGWEGDIAVSVSNNNSCSLVGTNTNKKIPYLDNITINTNSSKLQTSKFLSKDLLYKEINSQEKDDDIDSIIKLFHPNYYLGSTDDTDCHIALLKNDGTWDVVYTLPGFISGLHCCVSDFELHDKISNYARSCDGYLRCRITQPEIGQNRRIRYISNYYLLDYLPQEITLAKSSILPAEDEEDYYRDVKIGIKNLEGITKVEVSQLDEGNDLPYQYEVPNFKQGYFIATVDKDYTTTFKITAYNQNGTTESYPYILPPVAPSDINIEFNYLNEIIHINTTTKRDNLRKQLLSYKISKLSSASTIIEKECDVNDLNIDVSQLSKGLYNISIKDKKGINHNFKFKR